MARYKDYASLPEHIRGMLRTVTSDDAAAERYASVPNKLLDGKTVMELINRPFVGLKSVERFLCELGEYLGEDMDPFRESFGKKK